jgi:hypothetical protein
VLGYVRSRAISFRAGLMHLLTWCWQKIEAMLLWEIPVKKYERWGLYTQSSFVIVVYGFMELHPVFTGHPIATGYMIAALALAAVIMAARTDSLTTAEKIVWIAICAALFIWELNVIDTDHIQQDTQHSTDLAKQTKQFDSVLTENQQAFRATMEQLSTDSKAQQKQFAATMREFSTNEAENQSRFDKLFDHEEKLAQGQTGILIPANLPTPENSCVNIAPGAVLVIIGNKNNIAWFTHFPHVVVASKSAGNVLSVEKTAGDSIAIVFDLRSADGKIIARMDAKGYVINRNNTLAITKNDSDLTVVDLYGHEVLNVQYLNTHAISIRGENLEVVPFLQNSCLGEGSVSVMLP